jgi:hypothetical protein
VGRKRTMEAPLANEADKRASSPILSCSPHCRKHQFAPK